MVSGHLQTKKDYYYIVLSIKDENNKRKQIWLSTGLPMKNNKKRAEQMLLEARRNYGSQESEITSEDDETIINEVAEKIRKKRDSAAISELMVKWLKSIRLEVNETTYASYYYNVYGVINPYFDEMKMTLITITPDDIQDFYEEKLADVKASTVTHYHAILKQAFKYALKKDMIMKNPMEDIKRPKSEIFVGNFYNVDELNRLFDVVKGDKLELAVLFGAFYGLRRSEMVGLKWNAIDFYNNQITIQHTVTSCSINNKLTLVEKDTTKSKSSHRTLPLVEPFKVRLLELRDEQNRNRGLCGRSYNSKYNEYLYVDVVGDRIKPDYITERFPKFLAKHGLRRIRYHDLRHSCASLLLSNGVSMKEIQDWLGHSDFSTTANRYTHLDTKSKLNSADKMVTGLKLN